jgi:hypothetical protein
MKKVLSTQLLFAALALSAVLLSNNCAAQTEIYVTEWGNFFPGSGTLIKVNFNNGNITVVLTNLNIPSGVARDAHGNTIVADTGNGNIIKVAMDYTPSILASGLSSPSNPYIDPSGTIIVPNFGDGTVIGIAPNGTRTPVANGFPGPVSIRYGQWGWNASAGFYLASRGFSPGRVDYFMRNTDGSWTQETPISTNLALTYDGVPDQAGNLFVSEYGDSRILKFPISPGGPVSTNPVVFASGLAPVGLAFDRAGNLYEADLRGVINKFVLSNGTLGTNPVAVVTNLQAPAYLAFSPQPILSIGLAGANVVLTWPDPSFALQSAGALTSDFTNVPGATSPYTNPITRSPRFFMLESQ